MPTIIMLSTSAFAVFILAVLLDISINLRRLNMNVKKMIK
jgi:hypothetical protein